MRSARRCCGPCCRWRSSGARDRRYHGPRYDLLCCHRCNCSRAPRIVLSIRALSDHSMLRVWRQSAHMACHCANGSEVKPPPLCGSWASPLCPAPLAPRAPLDFFLNLCLPPWGVSDKFSRSRPILRRGRPKTNAERSVLRAGRSNINVERSVPHSWCHKMNVERSGLCSWLQQMIVVPQDERRTLRSTFGAPTDERRTPCSTFGAPKERRTENVRGAQRRT